MMMKEPIPEHFEQLTPEQVSEFARFGFQVYWNVRNSASSNDALNSAVQKISRQQAELAKAMHSCAQKVLQTDKTRIP